jgi:SAM-dependent methyltransferase
MYRWLEYASFGRALQRRREAFLPRIAGARRVLMLGDGDGRFLAAFLRHNPRAEVDSVDSSARMLAFARARAGTRQAAFHHADASIWQPPAGVKYDLLVTHFFLDCFDDDALARLIPSLAGAAAPAARWLVSEFRQPAAGPAAWRARVWIGCLYAGFGLVTGLKVRRLPDYRTHLRAQGFILEREAIAEWGLLTSELWRRGS